VDVGLGDRPAAGDGLTALDGLDVICQGEGHVLDGLGQVALRVDPLRVIGLRRRRQVVRVRDSDSIGKTGVGVPGWFPELHLRACMEPRRLPEILLVSPSRPFGVGGLRQRSGGAMLEAGKSFDKEAVLLLYQVEVMICRDVPFATDMSYVLTHPNTAHSVAPSKSY